MPSIAVLKPASLPGNQDAVRVRDEELDPTMYDELSGEWMVTT